jgi:hypothetical protein
VTPKGIQRILRYGVLVFVLAGAGYLVIRFDGLTLAADSPSPLLRFSPGDALVLDRYPKALLPDDPVVFTGPDGRVHLSLILKSRLEAGATEFWLGHDAPGCSAPDSQALGWVGKEWIVGRVIMVWPW